MSEVWKPVELFDIKWPDGTWRYMVSNFGRVKRTTGVSESGAYFQEMLLTSSTGMVWIGTGKHNSKYVHISRLVATAFIPNPNCVSTIRYLDGNRFNVRADNLAWDDGTSSASYGKKRRPVLQLDSDGKVIKRHESIVSAGRAAGITGRELRTYLNSKKLREVGGYFWRYAYELDTAEELKEKQNNFRKGRLVCTEVRQYTEDGLLVKVFESCSVAAQEIGLSQGQMSKWLNKESMRKELHRGYYWRRADSDEFAEANGLEQYIAPMVLQYTEDHILLNEFPTVLEASRATGVRDTVISSVCRRKYGYKLGGGYIWRFSDDDEFS